MIYLSAAGSGLLSLGKKPYTLTQMAFLLVLLCPVLVLAGNQNNDSFDPDYALRLNDREAGFYYYERVVPSDEGMVLEISMELHDHKTMGRYGCEQILRMVLQDLADSGILDTEDFGEPLVDEMTFYESYKLSFIRHASNIRPYKDLQDFFSESLRIWHHQNCLFLNRFESRPEWFLDLPTEQLYLSDSGMPKHKTINQKIPGISVVSEKEIQYEQDRVDFKITSEGYDEIRASFEVSGPVFDPFQINMIVASLDYHEGFEQSYKFKGLFVDVPLYEDWPEEGPETEAFTVDATIKVAGSMFLPFDGEEVSVWAVDVNGFELVSYHPLFHLVDHYHRRFDTVRYYICQSKGNILMVETLTSDGTPRGMFHAD
ncbi:MAG: hypothetical protein EA409_00770 [Saprospirales bacterium]|nr:MAG: hypothetical protein EA409_00770 [Saprospirales bacterium]